MQGLRPLRALLKGGPIDPLPTMTFSAAITPDARDLAAAQAVVAALPFEPLLYARIDMVRLPSGTLAVMEAELIEPYLYPEQADNLGELVARAVRARLPGGS